MLTKLFSAVVLTGSLWVAGDAATRQLGCCYPGADCCNPPQECCFSGACPTTAQTQAKADDCCAPGSACCNPANECCVE